MRSKPRTWQAALAVVGSLLALAAMPFGTANADGGGTPAPGAPVNLLAIDGHGRYDAGEPVPGPPGSFVGIDGLFYGPASFVTPGGNGQLFVGEEFDMLCGAAGKAFDGGLRRMGKLAALIEKSGRRALFAVAPNKSSVETPSLPVPLPHGECDAAGMERDRTSLDKEAKNPRFVPVLKELTRTPYAFWKTDTHWDTVGASVYAQQVAGKLSPKLANQQRYLDTTRTKLGDLVFPYPEVVPETAPARVPANGVTMSPAPGEPTFDPTLQHIYLHLAWDSSPARKVWPGRTLFLGDSFTYTALESLGNLVRHGQFMWLGYHSDDELAAAIKDSDTVVITVVQRFVSATQAQTPSLRKAVKQVLRSHR